eukprot:TRINITY_DN43072_c0_g1_i1.p1 TRINITY_DN43072_c0_g1~~TRINITY_DN43072_c0_g1_i1.p1  ORF type:complete len:437 (-),score=123.07 TRINITY_DN43072_c0_g1_i1:52-1362(-)
MAPGMVTAGPKRKSTGGHMAFGQRVTGRAPLTPSEQRALAAARKAVQAERVQAKANLEEARSLCAARADSSEALVQLLEASKKQILSLEDELAQVEARRREASAKEDAERALWVQEERPSLEAAVSRLKVHRDAWCKLCAELRKKVNKHEQELRELEEGNERGVLERRRLQGECLSLQQECEDARLELQGVQELLREGNFAVERMARQRLELEWEMEEGVKRQKMLQSVFEFSKHASHAEASREQQRSQEVAHSSYSHLQRHRSEAALHRSAAAGLQQQAVSTQLQCEELEKAVGRAAEEAASIERSVIAADREAEEEQQKEEAARQLLQQAQRQRQALEQHLADLAGKCKGIAAESLHLQEEHARLMLGRARRKAVQALQRSKSTDSNQAKLSAAFAGLPSDGSAALEMAVCKGVFGPAGAGRGRPPSPLHVNAR